MTESDDTHLVDLPGVRATILPQNADIEHIDAELNEGVLTIRSRGAKPPHHGGSRSTPVSTDWCDGGRLLPATR